METNNPTVERALEALRAVCQKEPEAIRPADTVDADPSDRWRAAFVQWFDSRIKLDVEGLLKRRPRWWTDVYILHGDFSCWSLAHHLIPPTSEQFRGLLLELCLDLRRDRDEEIVAHVQLRRIDEEEVIQ